MTVWSFLHRIRIPLFALAAGATALLAPSAMSVEMDPSNLSLLENDQTLRDHETFVRRFGSDDSVIVALESENVLAGEALAWLDRFATAQMSDPATGAGIEAIRPDELWGKERFSARRWKLAVKKYPELTRNFISPDGRMILLDIRLKPGLSSDERHRTVFRLKQWIAGHPPASRYYLTGSAVEQDAFIAAMQKDHARFTPLTLALILALIVVFSGHWAAAFFPAAVMALTVTSTYAWMHASGQKLTPLTLLLAPTLITVSITDAVHLQSRVRHITASDGGERLQKVCRELAVPCFFTTVTTAAGFASLAVSPVPAVRSFGICGTFGILAAYVWTLVLTPFFLDAAAGWSPRIHVLPLRFWELLSDFTLNFIVRFKFLILLAMAVSAAWAATSLRHMDMATDVLKFFAAGHPFRISTEAIQDHFDGIFPLEIVPGDRNKIASPETLPSRLEAIPGIRRVLFHPAGDHATAFLRSSNSKEVMRIATDIRRLGSGITAGSDILVTGQIYLLGKMSQELVTGLLRSLAGALALIGALMAFLLRSPRLGFYCLMSNVWPLVITFGIMPALGIPLSTATATIGCLALGLTVDNAIHLLYRFQDAARTLPPLGISSLVLAGGFGICLSGSIQATVHFGFLMPLIILLGYFSNIAMLTALLTAWPHRSCASC